MKTASDIVQTLLERPASTLLDRKTGMPYGWSIWLRTQALQDRPADGTASPSAWIVGMQQRSLPEVSGIPHRMGMLRAFRSLFHQGWEPPPRELRWVRWFAAITSLLIHTLFVLFLLWIALITWIPLPPEEEEGSRVRLEFIGRGTPEEEGGGSPAETGMASQAASTAVAVTESQVQMRVPVPSMQVPAPATTTDAELPPVAQQEIPEPAPVQQILQVTETEVPTLDFVLPPVTPPVPDSVVLQVAESGMVVREREITVVRAPAVRTEVPDVAVETPRISRPVAEIHQREVPVPVEAPRTTALPVREVAAPQLRGIESTVRQVEIPAPSSGTSAADSVASTGTATAATTAEATGREREQGTSQGGRSDAASSGPQQSSRSGGLPSPQRGDDWGISDRNQAGDAGVAPGLFDGDGRVRLPGQGTGSDTAQQRGAPGSANDRWTQDRIDRAGTWMERPPYGYEPTRFDRYWIPNENLLEEWVRKNVRTTSIPIPGTSKRIVCVVSVLQLGGGCGVVDDNLNEQPATARPPPEIPVKRTPIPTGS